MPLECDVYNARIFEIQNIEVGPAYPMHPICSPFLPPRETFVREPEPYCHPLITEQAVMDLSLRPPVIERGWRPEPRIEIEPYKPFIPKPLITTPSLDLSLGLSSIKQSVRFGRTDDDDDCGTSKLFPYLNLGKKKNSMLDDY